MSPADDTLQVELEEYLNEMNINTTSSFIAAREAVKGFKKLGAEGVGGTYIHTGNKLNVLDVVPGPLVFGIGKAAARKLMQTASKDYRGQGYKCVCCPPADLASPRHQQLTCS